MRELLNNLFNRHYNAVHQSEIHQDQRSPVRKLETGFSIVDSLFAQRDGSEKRWPTCVFLLMIGGLCMIASGVIMHFYDPYELIFRWKLQFDDGGEIFELWRKPPVPIYCKVYLFNITNAEDFLAGHTDKLQVAEVGPYVYRELFAHNNVTFNDNDTITTFPRHPLVWEPERSQGRSEDDVLYLPNIAMLAIANYVADKSFFFRLPINMVIRNKNEQPLVKMTAREFMFGYETALTTLGNNLIPHWIFFDKVGLVDRMYDFEGDYETMFAGHTDPSISGLIDTYRGSPTLPQWDGDHCSSIRYASDGVKFKSFVAENETLLFFRKSMCRSMKLVESGNSTIVNGLQANKYVFEENSLDNGEINEENKCFCRDGKCLPRGLIDVSECYYGFPIALSYPHFMDADPNVLTTVEGVKPDPKLHESFFMINRESGLPLRISAKLQINMAMNDVSNMANAERFSNRVIPMLWFDISLEALPQGLNNRFIFYLNMLPGFVKCCYYGCLIGGPILLLWALIRVVLQLSGGKKKIVVLRNLNGTICSAYESRQVDHSDLQHMLDHEGVDGQIKAKDTLSQNSSSGISSQSGSTRGPSLVDDQLTELRIIEDSDHQTTMLDLYRKKYIDHHQSSSDSISGILDQV